VRGGSFSRSSFFIAGDWRVSCLTYSDTPPIFDLDIEGSSLGIHLRGRTADKAAVEFARALADETRKYADEMERIYTAQPGGVAKAADSDAA
jgi:hypothetical protein